MARSETTAAWQCHDEDHWLQKSCSSTCWKCRQPYRECGCCKSAVKINVKRRVVGLCYFRWYSERKLNVCIDIMIRLQWKFWQYMVYSSLQMYIRYLECKRHTSCCVKILSISGSITGATTGMWISVTSRQNSAVQQSNCIDWTQINKKMSIYR